MVKDTGIKIGTAKNKLSNISEDNLAKTCQTKNNRTF